MTLRLARSAQSRSSAASDVYERQGSSYEADVKAIEGQNGRKVTIDNHPLAVAPGHSLVVAKSRSLRHQNHGIDLDVSARTALYSPFEYAGP